ncbi:MAG TPA: CheR family methyltransferase [Puia sp.]|nr:CheR family methyltransferase [Puia sp.]
MKSKGSPKPFPVVAIGASAGGLEAISKLLENLSPSLGMAYIVIQHLSPDHESILPELLHKKTKMKVLQVENGMEVLPDAVFVIPPNAFMSIVDGKLTLIPRKKNDGTYHSIDFFLTALAPIYQNNAIAVILSGTATDGTAGVRAIKAEGGITFAQDYTAKFMGMPNNASDSGYVDFVLPPEKIARELEVLSKLPYLSLPSQDDLTGKEVEVRKIHAVLHNKWQVDFSNYKQSTILRRIFRRMTLNKLKNLEEYTHLLRNRPAEVDLLYKDLLINVTSFFREPALYEAMGQKIFPALFKDRRPSEAIRIWIPACSSGEEACSIAICLYEYLGDQAIASPIQIFATDLSDSAIEKARAGIYTKADLQNVSAQRLQRFFIKVEGNFQIIKPIRDICIYATHNLLKDPPFSRIDLISCQNVLIYLEAGAQKRILRSFHYALKPSGYLLLGKSEALGSATELFASVDKQFKLFSKKITPSNFNFDFSIRSGLSLPGITTDEERMIAEQDGEEDIEKETNKLLLAGYTPAGVTINKEWQIVHFHGDVSSYLRPNQGKASLHLLKMVRDELVFELRALLQRIKKEAQPVKKEQISLDQDKKTISIEAIPLRAYSKHPYYLILFRDSVSAYQMEEFPDEKAGGNKKGVGDRKIALLQLELKEAREQMKAMSEEFEAVREELQSANEEILSSNEELQSINEELETSKEELQSANEELTTINDELNNRNTDLKEAVDYSEAVIQTIREPLVVLNADLRIRTANKAFYILFKLKPEDAEGHYFYEMGNGLWNIPKLKDQLNEIIHKNKSFENFELTIPFEPGDSKILLFNAMRMNQENDSRNRFLLAIEDITERKRSEEAISQSNTRYENFIAQSSEGICRFELKKSLPVNETPVKQLDHLYRYAQLAESNDAIALMHGRSHAADFLGADLDDLLPSGREGRGYIARFIEAGYQLANEEIGDTDKENNTRYYICSLIGIVEEEELKRIWIIQKDITERKKIENDLKQSEERFRLLVQNAFDIITIYAEDGTIKYQSESLERVLGYHPSERIGTNIFQQPFVHPDDIILKQDMFRRCLESPDENIRTQFRMQHKNGQYRMMEAVCTNLLGYETINGLVANYRDITEKDALEKQKEEFIGIASHELKTPITSIKGYTQIIRNSLMGSQDQDTVRLVERLDRQVNRLTDLVKDLLDVTKITGGQLQLTINSFDINELIGEIADEIQQTFQKHELILELKEVAPVSADRERTGQVLTNILSNAIKYSPDANNIIIRSAADDKKVTISVEDFGIGISKEVQEKVFQQFFRVHHHKMNIYPGLGLGLYIATQLVSRQGGAIWVDSVPGSGSTFHFTLPLA